MLRGFTTKGRYYEADAGTPSGGTSEGDTVAAPAKAEKTFTQSELEAIVKDRLERSKRAADAQADKARADAEAKALAEQGEFRTLAEQRAERIKELETATEAGKQTQQQLERYQATLKKHLDSQRADLPPHITTLLDKLDVADQLDWLSENKAALKAPGDGVGSPAGGKRPMLSDTGMRPRTTI
jgi:DNA polymerase III alpha subunit